MVGSAIVRFQDTGRFLVLYDTQYQVLKVFDDYEAWDLSHSQGGDCLTHLTRRTDDSTSYSGTRAAASSGFSLMMHSPDQRERSPGVLINPLSSLSAMPFVERTTTTKYGSCTGSSSSARPVTVDVNVIEQIAVGDHSYNSLYADPKDPTSFSVSAHGSPPKPGNTPVRNETFEWSADAHRMGKCEMHGPPISDGDPVIKHEEVDLDADRTEVNATPPVGGENQGIAQLTATVTCERVPIQNAEVQVKVEAVDKSGGHIHSDDNRPRGKINGADIPKDGLTLKTKTDANGKIKFKYAAPLTGKIDQAGYGKYDIGIAGDYSVTAKSVKFPAAVSPAVAITSQVDGLEDGSGNPAYLSVGETATHPVNHYFSAGTLDAFNQLAGDFSQVEQDHEALLSHCQKPAWFNPPVKLEVNDVALPEGGIFDWHSTWQPSHGTHNKGEGGDFNKFTIQSTPQSGISGSGKDCNSTCTCTSVKKLAWLVHTLLEEGESYGKWDCNDLGGPPGCDAGEPPTSVGYIVSHPGNPSANIPSYPPRLHLHVEDAKP
jgi:hypothetical protein